MVGWPDSAEGCQSENFLQDLWEDAMILAGRAVWCFCWPGRTPGGLGGESFFCKPPFGSFGGKRARQCCV